MLSTTVPWTLKPFQNGVTILEGLYCLGNQKEFLLLMLFKVPAPNTAKPMIETTCEYKPPINRGHYKFQNVEN